VSAAVSARREDNARCMAYSVQAIVRQYKCWPT
jgi:hypothetical protein